MAAFFISGAPVAFMALHPHGFTRAPWWQMSMIWRLIHTGLLSGGMSALVALIVTIVNTGTEDGLAMRWLIGWSLAYPVAWFAALIWGPSARMLTNWLTGTDRNS
ncbi:MAG: DUF2798 domain-containing protein [Henriciella sp.]